VTTADELNDEAVRAAMTGAKGRILGGTSPGPSPRQSPSPSPRLGPIHPVALVTNDGHIVGSSLMPAIKLKTGRITTLDHDSSTSIKIEGEEQVIDKLYELTDEQNGSVLWLAFGYEGKSLSTLRLTANGDYKGKETLQQAIEADPQHPLALELVSENLRYLLLKFYVSIKKGDQESIKTRFVQVTYKGGSIKPYFKAISSNHSAKFRSTVSKVLQTITHYVTITSIDEFSTQDSWITEGEIIPPSQALSKLSTTTISTPRQLSQTALNLFSGLLSRQSSKSSLLMSPRASPRASPRGKPPTPTVRVDPSALGGGLKIEEDEKFVEIFKQVTGDALNWVLLSYHPTVKLTFQVSGSGSEGLPQAVSLISDQQVQYIIYKQHIDNTAKIVLLNYLGPKSKSMIRASAAQHRQNLYKYLSQLMKGSTAGLSDMQTADISEIDESFIVSKIKGTSAPLVSNFKNVDVNISKQPTVTNNRAQNSSSNKGAFSIIDDDTIVKDALLDLKSDSTDTNWILFEYNEKDNSAIQFSGKGSKGLDELRTKLNTKRVQYALLKLFVDETGYGGSPKIVLIVWVGGSVVGLAKARSSTHRIALEEFLKKTVSIAGQFPVNVDDPEQLKEEDIRGKLTGMKGKADSSTPQKTATSTTPTRSFGGRNSTLQYAPDEETVNKKIAQLREKDGLKWLMFSYSADDDYRIEVVHEGTSASVEDFKPFITNDKIYFILMRLALIEFYGVAKCILITYVGDNAPGFSKARSAGHRINLYDHAKKNVSVGGELNPQNLNELTDQAVIAKITGAKDDSTVEMPNISDEQLTNTRFEQQRAKKEVEIVVKNKSQFTGEFKAIEFGGKEAIREALQQLVSQQNPQDQIEMLNQRKDNPVIISYVKMPVVDPPKYRTIEVTDTDYKGNKLGLIDQEWRDKHLDTKDSFFFAFAVTSSEGGYGLATKYLLVQWVGRDVKHLIRSKIAELRQSVYNFVDDILHLSGEIQGCTSPEHLTQKLVLEKLTGTNVRGESMKLEKKQAKYENLGRSKSRLTFKNENEIVASLKKLTDESDEHLKSGNKIDWFMVTYVEEAIDVMESSIEGKGGLETLTEHLNPNSVAFIVIRVMHAFGYLADLATISEHEHAKPYYGMILWKGSKVTLLEKAMVGHHFNAFSKLIEKQMSKLRVSLQGTHYQPETKEELTEERLKKAFRLFEGDEIKM
jgi:phosphopantetheinyl transferase (holo-ACP synthase)